MKILKYTLRVPTATEGRNLLTPVNSMDTLKVVYEGMRASNASHTGDIGFDYTSSPNESISMPEVSDRNVDRDATESTQGFYESYSVDYLQVTSDLLQRDFQTYAAEDYFMEDYAREDSPVVLSESTSVFFERAIDEANQLLEIISNNLTRNPAVEIFSFTEWVIFNKQTYFAEDYALEDYVVTSDL